jgi:hypothetical protein
MAVAQPMVIEMKTYAVTVTTKLGDQEVTKRYEAPTAEEAMRMAGEFDMVAKPKDDDTVEIVTLQTVAPPDNFLV